MDHKIAESVKRSRDGRVLKTRASLRHALLELLETQDLASLTVQAVVERASVGYATFFRHYPSVELLLVDVADEMIAGFIGSVMPLLLAGERGPMLTALVDYAGKRRTAVHALLVGGGETVRRELVSRAVAAATTLPHGYDDAVPLPLAIRHAVGAAVTILTWWVTDKCAAPAVQVTELIDRLALRPLDPAA